MKLDSHAAATAKDMAEDLEIEAVYKKQPERKKNTVI